MVIRTGIPVHFQECVEFPALQRIGSSFLQCHHCLKRRLFSSESRCAELAAAQSHFQYPSGAVSHKFVPVQNKKTPNGSPLIFSSMTWLHSWPDQEQITGPSNSTYFRPWPNRAMALLRVAHRKVPQGQPGHRSASHADCNLPPG